jgi:hypothetical protein
VRAVLLFGGASAAALAMMVLNRPPVFGPLFGSFVLLFLLLLQRQLIGRFKPGNWLVRRTDSGLYIKFRSYLNYHFPDDDPCVLYVRFDEIARANLLRERLDTPQRNTTAATTSYQTIVELHLHTDWHAAWQAIADEEGRQGPKQKLLIGTGSTTVNDHPVRTVADGTLQIQWSARPSARAFLSDLAQQVTVTPAEKEHVDLAQLKHTSAEEQDARLRELVLSGKTIEAIEVKRLLDGSSLEAAKAYVDRLSH